MRVSELFDSIVHCRNVCMLTADMVQFVELKIDI